MGRKEIQFVFIFFSVLGSFCWRFLGEPLFEKVVRGHCIRDEP